MFKEYPYINLTDLNLDYMYSMLKNMDKRLSDYVKQSTITFHDPITWDITDQYTVNTMVVDSDGTAYLSIQAVPAGINISDTDYWQPIFNYDDNINVLRDNITTNTRSTGVLPEDVAQGDMVWYQGDLYKVRSNLSAGSVIIPNTNADLITVEDWVYLLVNAEKTARENADTALQNADTTLQNNINNEKTARENADIALQNADTTLQNNINAEESARIAADNNIMGIVTSTLTVVDTPEAHGAKGNGIADDTAYVQAALNNAKIVVCAGIYRITQALTVPDNVTVMGGGTFIIDGNFSALNMGNSCSISNITFRDTGAEYIAANYIITAQNKSNLSVVECNFIDIHLGHCINFITCQNITITKNVINKYSYAGITLSNGCFKADVTFNYVYDGQYTATNNRYAIILAGYGDVSDGGPSDRIYCAYNTCVDTTPWWEGIDSHGCTNTEICYNIISGFPNAIAMVDPTSAPMVTNIQNISIHNNVCNVSALNGSASGIIISSAYTPKRGISIRDNYVKIPVNVTYHTHGSAGIGLRGAGTWYENVEIINNYIYNQSIGIGLQGYFRNMLIDGNIINGMLTQDDYALLMYEVTKFENIKITNNTVGNEATIIRGFNLSHDNTLSSKPLITVSDNQIYTSQNKYYNAGWSTAPYYTNSITPSSSGMIGQFRPYEGVQNYAGWICTTPGTWKQIAAT